MDYDAVLFDMDGTILDTLEDMHASVNAALRHFALPEIGMADTAAFVGNGARRLVEQAVPAGTPSALTEQVLAWYKPYYNDHSRIKTKPYEGIRELMENLRRDGCGLAVVSNKPDRTVRELAEIFFAGLLESAVGESDTIRRKPAPDTVLRAAEAMGIPRERCVYVGDSEVDVATARNAGMDCIAVKWGFRSEEQLIAAGAERIAATPRELERMIRGVKG